MAGAARSGTHEVGGLRADKAYSMGKKKKKGRKEEEKREKKREERRKKRGKGTAPAGELNPERARAVNSQIIPNRLLD